jgi:hypothetical protein
MRDEQNIPKLMPIFPLNTVLMPGQLMPLHIFENRYRRLINDLLILPEVERKFGIVSIAGGFEVNEDMPKIADVGTTAVLKKSTANDDETFEILILGCNRFDIKSISMSKAPYLIAEVVDREEINLECDPVVLTLAKEKCSDYMMMFDADNYNASEKLPNSSSELSFLISSLLPINTLDQQKLLETDDALSRLKSVLKIINRETILMQEIPSVPAPFLSRMTISPN